MISAFAKGAQVWDDERYLGAAERATNFILTRMYDATSGVLLRRYRDGDAAIAGFLDDYAFFIGALLDLYEAGFDARHIEAAMRLTEDAGAVRGRRGMARSSARPPVIGSLVLRMKDDYDGAEPSGNAVSPGDLLRLAHFTDRADYREAAEQRCARWDRKSRSKRCGAADVGGPRLLSGLSARGGSGGGG